MKKSLSILREDNILLPSALEMVKGGDDSKDECTLDSCTDNSGTCSVNQCKINQKGCDVNKCLVNRKEEIGTIKPGVDCPRAIKP